MTNVLKLGHAIDSVKVFDYWVIGRTSGLLVGSHDF